MNLFDGLRDKAVAVVARTMGYTATWNPSNNSAQQTAEVLYSDATEEFEKIGEEVNYEPFDYRIEYSYLKLLGLKESVDDGGRETISILLPIGTKRFYVEKVSKKADGCTLVAYLTKKAT